MESKSQTLTLSSIFLLTLLGFASSDIKQDKAACTNQVMGLAPCLPYVDGEAKTPTIDCCSGLKQVLDKSKKCLCVLIKDAHEPGLGFNVNAVNATLAATLPSTCRTSVNMTDCIPLLNLAPNSKEAKLFEGYQNMTERHHKISTTIIPSTSGNSTSNGAGKSDGGKGKKWVGIELALGVSLWIFTLHQNIHV